MINPAAVLVPRDVPSLLKDMAPDEEATFPCGDRLPMPRSCHCTFLGTSGSLFSAGGCVPLQLSLTHTHTCFLTNLFPLFYPFNMNSNHTLNLF